VIGKADFLLRKHETYSKAAAWKFTITLGGSYFTEITMSWELPPIRKFVRYQLSRLHEALPTLRTLWGIYFGTNATTFERLPMPIDHCAMREQSLIEGRRQQIA